jgi:hypothetical protein
MKALPRVSLIVPSAFSESTAEHRMTRAPAVAVSPEPTLPQIAGALDPATADADAGERSGSVEYDESARARSHTPTSPRDLHLVRMEDLRRQQNEELLVS